MLHPLSTLHSLSFHSPIQQQSNMLSTKLVLISTTFLSAAAVMLLLSTTDIAVYAPWIYNGVVSWLQPPYLYLVINCIIITIVASSKLQSTTDAAVSLPPSITPLLATIPAVQPQLVEIIRADFLTPAADYKYESVHKGLELEDPSTAKDKIGDSPTAAYRIEDSWSIVNGAEGTDDAMSNKENEGGNVVASSIWSADRSNDERDFVKPSPSARFGHRRNGKVSPEGGRRVLGVSKPKKQDTMDNTWRTITEGRAIPISRHLKKSDTLAHTHSHQQQQENTPPLNKTMRKAETFNDRSAATNVDTSPATTGGSGKVKREASLSQEELNRRVEAFIKKFNEDMRLQRQESLKQYTQMVNQ